MSKEPQIIIPLSEYERINREIKTLKEAFNKKCIAIHHEPYFSGSSGYSLNSYAIINETELVRDLNSEIKRIRDEYNEAYRKLSDYEYKHKKGFWA